MPTPNSPVDTMTPDGLPNGTAIVPPNVEALSGGEIAAAPAVSNAPTSPSFTENDQTERPEADLMNQFEQAANNVVTLPTTVNKTATAKPAQLVDTPPPATTTTPAAIQQQQTAQQVATSHQRNYEALPPEIRDHAKKMSNDAFKATSEYIAKQRAENEKIAAQLSEAKKGGIPDSYLEHPDAYILTPEFTQAASAAQDAQAIFQHWQSQLNEVRSGALEYKPLVRNQQGQLAYGTPVKATANSETELLAMFNAAQNQAMQYQTKVQSVKDSYASKYTEAKGWLNNLESASYQAFNDEKNPLTAAYKQALAQFPSAYRSNPLASLLAKSMVANGQLMTMLRESQQNGKTNGAATVTQQHRNAGPNLGDIQGDGAAPKAAADSVTFDDFERIRHGY